MRTGWRWLRVFKESVKERKIVKKFLVTKDVLAGGECERGGAGCIARRRGAQGEDAGARGPVRVYITRARTHTHAHTHTVLTLEARCADARARLSVCPSVRLSVCPSVRGDLA